MNNYCVGCKQPFYPNERQYYSILKEAITQYKLCLRCHLYELQEIKRQSTTDISEILKEYQ